MYVGLHGTFVSETPNRKSILIATISHTNAHIYMSVVTFADHAGKNKQKTTSPQATSKYEVTLPTASVRAHHLAAS